MNDRIAMKCVECGQPEKGHDEVLPRHRFFPSLAQTEDRKQKVHAKGPIPEWSVAVAAHTQIQWGSWMVYRKDRRTKARVAKVERT